MDGFSAAARHAPRRRFAPSFESGHADLWRLEACAEEALSKADADGGLQCLDWLKNAPRFNSDYYLEFLSNLSYSYIFGHAGKRRIKQLPGILRQMSCYSEAYQKFAAEVKKFVKEKNCPPKSVSDGREWKDFNW